MIIGESYDRKTLFVLEPTMDDEGGSDDSDSVSDLDDADVIAMELRKRRREE